MCLSSIVKSVTVLRVFSLFSVCPPFLSFSLSSQNIMNRVRFKFSPVSSVSRVHLMGEKWRDVDR